MAETLTGRKRSVRADMRRDMEDLPEEMGIEEIYQRENKEKGFYKELGIEEDRRSLPYQAWTKGQIERFFSTVCEDFTKGINSYVGTLTGSKTSGKVVKDIKGMLEKGKLPDIKEFADRFEYWNLNVYGRNVHKGLKEQGERYLTPMEVYMNEERYRKAAPPMEYIERIAMVKERRRVYAAGIRMFGCDYMHEDLLPYINASEGVIVRYDRNDVSRIKVYDARTDRLICEAGNADLLNPLAPVGDKTLAEHIKRQKRQEKAAKELLARGAMTYEERMETEAAERAVITPEVRGEQKVTRLPEDKSYLLEKREAERRKEEEEKEIEEMIRRFYRKQAEEAMRETARRRMVR